MSADSLREWKRLNPEKVKASGARYRDENRELLRKKGRDYVKRTRARANQISSEWKKKNRSKVNAQRRIYRTRNAHREPLARERIANSLRARMLRLVRDLKAGKSTFELIGLPSWSLFSLWISSQWEDGMTWSNFGAWHIDHIIPLKAFNLKDRTEALRAFNFKNLQPLWGIDNTQKGSNMERKEVDFTWAP